MTIKILAIDAASDACSVALFIDGFIYERFQIAPQQHTHLLLPMVKELLLEHHLSLSQLNALAFGQGPGSFTGIRIATGVIQGLAFAQSLPVVPISSLRALAQTVYAETKNQKILVAIDARMNEVYWAYFELGNDNVMQLVGNENISSPESVEFPAGADWVGVGTGWTTYQGLLPNYTTQRILENCYPHASAIAQIAHTEYLKGKAVSAELALPNYLRETVAWKKGQSK